MWFGGCDRIKRETTGQPVISRFASSRKTVKVSLEGFLICERYGMVKNAFLMFINHRWMPTRSS
ncbi:hypothetical protein HanXRQr2_Chr15g0706191 [Helianthus annuus]|uniref:Uncharacterized protein n=1 Tax=Helianthus annuus TaxID=4232 RepID=A0A251SA60_HELAN|nr:hypothetical protein HanXRQr2_Chr15g0706191 [Helianthus annuus]KAJ0832352.1 hypothetical protein HanPSC8_Chr15g0677831 [Helianthus annuus]